MGNSFKRNSYNEDILKDYISKEEFEQNVEAFSKIAYKCYSRKRLLDNNKIPEYIMRLFALSLALIICSMFNYYFGTIKEIPFLFWASLILLAAGSLIAISMVTKFLLLNFNEFPSFELMVKKELDNYFKCINPAFTERGLYWKAVNGHYWIELRIDQALKDKMKKQHTIK